MSTSIDITLTIAYVGFGGNTGGGKYFYSFQPDVVALGEGQRDVTINYVMSPDVSPHLEIQNVISSDSKDQINGIHVHDGGRHAHVINRNTKPTLIFFSVLVKDHERGHLISCDPQVANDPKINP